MANDLSTRDWQKVPELSGSQWCRSKSFDGFAPLGPVLATKARRRCASSFSRRQEEIADPGLLRARN